MDPLIDEAQSVFLKKSHISIHIRLVLDLLDYSHLSINNGFIFFLDFYKAFNMVEHAFIFRSLEKCGFGDFFCKAIKTCKGTRTAVLNLNVVHPSFHLKHCIRQGCPICRFCSVLSL